MVMCCLRLWRKGALESCLLDNSDRSYPFLVSPMRFFEFWSNEMWPVLSARYTELLAERPAKQDEASGRLYSKLMEEIKKKNILRQVTCNLAWTDPAENTVMQEDISLAMVENFVVDTFMGSRMHEAVDLDNSGQAVIVADDDHAVPERSDVAGVSTLRDSILAQKRLWRIPTIVPKFLNIPIALTSKEIAPTKGKFRRYGMDCAVNGVWLALYWAMKDGDNEAKDAIERLILDWPFDFQVFEPSPDAVDGNAGIEEAIFKAMTNLPLETERLRDFFGFTAKNLMLICGQVKKILTQKGPGKQSASAKDVWTWLVKSGNVNWGMFRTPSEKVVRCHLSNFELLERNPACKVIMDEALVQFGRDNLFDIPSTVNTLLHKCETVNDMVYAFKWLYGYMLRKKVKAPFSEQQEIAVQGGVLAQCHWARRYKTYLLKTYPAVVQEPQSTEAAGSPAAVSVAPGFLATGSVAKQPINLRSRAKSCMLDPLFLYQTLEGPNRSQTFLTALPSEALRKMLAHVSDIDRGVYATEIKGALTSQAGASRYDPEKFLAGDRPKNRFMSDFAIAYKALTLKQHGNGETPAEEYVGEVSPTVASAQGEPSNDPGAAADSASKHNMDKLKKDVEESIGATLDTRLVCLTKDGQHDELVKSVASTDLYQQLSSENARFVGVYEVENARLCTTYEKEGIFQREPPIDLEDFSNFSEVMDKLMKPDCDLYLIFCGAHESSYESVMEVVGKKGWKSKMFYLNYDVKAMEEYYWKRRRGLANSNSLKRLVVCWKGKQPTNMPSERKYVDPNSHLYCMVINKVPISPPKELTWLEKVSETKP